MPLTAVAYKKKLEDKDLQERITKLYDISPEFADGHHALGSIKEMLSKGETLYLGMFNDKPITAVMIRGHGTTKMVQYIVVHKANRGRGLSKQLIQQACQQEMLEGTENFRAGCGAIHKVLSSLNLLLEG